MDLISKYTTLSRAKMIVSSWRATNKSISLTNGVFDLLHPGHLSLLESASKFGHKLIVAINTDQSVAELKGTTRPIQSLHDRAYQLCCLSMVDLVISFSDSTPLALINAIKPDHLIKGGDYQISEIVGSTEVMSYGGKIHIIPTFAEYSTTNLIEKIKNS